MSFPEFLFVLFLFRSAKLSALLQQICENSQLLPSVEGPPLRAPTHTPTSHILTVQPSECVTPSPQVIDETFTSRIHHTSPSLTWVLVWPL
ncbi:hypothetical protein CEP52_008081 [Fusarium oligoseptatum]|uniref:Secreted protein n=1 Tax=Fusarium oligoseptatum TaxID=2604345 RepID=A0A428TJK5_9HYPO|nr:hypothetical protein CEP52_008081 [Fusarium oligoseptatum]